MCSIGVGRPAKLSDQEHWNGGITWWRYGSDDNPVPHHSLPTELPEIQVKCDPAQVFLAKALVHGPPNFSYRLDISTKMISLSKASNCRLAVHVTLNEPRKYTINTYTTEIWPLAVLSRETTSRGGLCISMCSTWRATLMFHDCRAVAMSLLDPGTDLWWHRPAERKYPYTRDNFQEFEPQSTVKGFEVHLEECEPQWVTKYDLSH